MNQAQKIYRLECGDCCLGFCGDSQVAYPLFIQVGSALSNYIKTRTRAEDITNVTSIIGSILNNLMASWELSTSDKAEEVKDTNILFAGWSWKFRRFEIGYFKSKDAIFNFHHSKTKLPHPWATEDAPLYFIGDYKEDYMKCLVEVLEQRHGKQTRKQKKKIVNFDYEPIEALAKLLSLDVEKCERPSIGGAPQLLKIYPFGNDLPIVLRMSAKEHYLLGRKLFDWEKTSFPILDLSKQEPVFFYPLAEVPTPEKLLRGVSIKNDAPSSALLDADDLQQ